MTGYTDPFSRNYMIGFKYLDALAESANAKYPPHNIVETGEDTAIIELAVAGIRKEQLSVTQDDNRVVIEHDPLHDDDPNRNVVYQGISQRAFRKEFVLGEHNNVERVEYVDGILSVYIRQEIPEELKPKKFNIN